MPQVTCPNCGAVRLVVEGKKKNCRKCGTPLTANMPKLKEPQPAVETVTLTAADAEAKIKEEIGKMDVKVFAEQFPKLFKTIAGAVKRTLKKGKDKDGNDAGPTT